MTGRSSKCYSSGVCTLYTPGTQPTLACLSRCTQVLPAHYPMIYFWPPGSVAGLPNDMPTMPQLLRKAGYSAHMVRGRQIILSPVSQVGKWHLGHSQPQQGPIGRGFQSHTGSNM